VNILYLNNYHYLRGGAETIYLAELALMLERGNTAYSFSRKHPRNYPTPWNSFYPKDMLTDTTKPSLQAFLSLIQFFYSYQAKNSLQRMLKHIRPDIAHAHNIYGRLTTSVLDVLKKNNIPVVMTLHDTKLICPTYKFLKRGLICEECKGHLFYRAITNRCHKESFLASSIYAIESYFNYFTKKYVDSVSFFITPSLFLKKKMVQYGWDNERIVHVPNFVNTSSFVPVYSPGKYILYIGRLSPEKGVETLVRAYLKLQTDTIPLVIVGEGPLGNRLMALTATHPGVQFTGYLTGDSLKSAIQSSRAVIVPSICYENAPISILESFAFGKPVIGSRIGGIPEMIDDGVDGFLFESGNTEDLRDKFEYLLSMPLPQLKTMGQAARRKIEMRYTADLHYFGLMELYEKLSPCSLRQNKST
jgi:glycosyltransferase involved in cell wall biosynthesis